MLKYDTSVYYLTSTRSDQIKYIGITGESLKKRLWRHLWDASNGKRKQCRRTHWINKEIKSGYEIKITLITSCLILEKALTVEMDLIKESREMGLKLVNTTDGGDGYRGIHSPEHNLKKGRRKGFKMSDESKAKMKLSANGRTFSAETRKKLGVAASKRIMTDSTRKKLSLSAKSRAIHFSEEARKKAIIASTGRKKTAKENEKRCAHIYVKVDQISKEDVFIKTWKSPSKVKNELKICPSSIVKACKGKRLTAGGYKWKYNEKTN